MGTYRVTGRSGQSEVIEAENLIDANRQFADHHGEPAIDTVNMTVKEAVITEEDTARD